jgi:hypothetical protein
LGDWLDVWAPLAEKVNWLLLVDVDVDKGGDVRERMGDES